MAAIEPRYAKLDLEHCMKKIFAIAWITINAGILTHQASAAVLANTIATGTGYLTIDRAAWATVAPSEAYTDISGNPTGTSGPTADAAGQRWVFADRVEGSTFGAASYPSDYLTPLPDTALNGSFAFSVNSYGTNSFATGNKITDYNSTTNPNGFIGLGGSIRATSDFNEPGASVWWEHLALRQDPTDSIWKLFATSGPGQGSVFEFTNVMTSTVNGSLSFSGDYTFGNSDWYQFFQSSTAATISQTAVLGHFDLTPVAAPEPSKFMFLGLGAMLTLLRRKRTA